MSDSYGSKIYKQPAKKKWSFIPLLVIVVILAGGYFFFKSMDKPQVDLQPPGGSAPVETVPETTPSPLKEPPVPLEKKEERRAPEPKQQKKSSAPKKSVSATQIALNPPGRMPDMKAQREKAKKKYDEKKYNQALELYLEISKEDITAYTQVGMCYYFLEDYFSARRYLEDALANDNDDFEALKFMAFTSYRQDYLDESREQAEQALKIKEKDKDLKYLLDKLDREITVMEDNSYKDARIPKFKLQFSREEHQDARDVVLGILKKAYRQIGRELNYYPDQDITVILYNGKTFFDVTRSPGWAGGLYDGKIRIPIRGYEGQEQVLEKILFHEYVHALVHFLANDCPLWLNEGLAEYFSEGELPKIKQILPLNMMEKRFPSDGNVVMVAYRQSYSVVCDMIDKFGLYRIKELLEAQKKHQDIRKSFKEVLFTDYDRFIENWGRD
jgi:tetratricopeptide (TPR) repeat protein